MSLNLTSVATTRLSFDVLYAGYSAMDVTVNGNLVGKNIGPAVQPKASGPMKKYSYVVSIPAALLTNTNKISFSQGVTGPHGNRVIVQNVSATSTNVALDLKGAAPPDTVGQAQPDYDILAWNTFIAMNWPAVVGQPRGVPDLSTGTSFVKGPGAGQLVVWETFREKREVFNYNTRNDPVASEPNDWNTLPADEGRHFYEGTKLFDSLDETIEVASESLETTAPGLANNPLLHRVVAPRVYLGKPTAAQLNAVRHEVKVNDDFFQYVKTNKFYYDPYTKEKATVTSGSMNMPPVTLPYRTSAGKASTSPTLGNSVRGYSAATTLTTYKDIQTNKTATLPGIGSVHIKAAWINLDVTHKDASKYYTAKAQYFSGDPAEPNTTAATFGLVGIHIIQRIHTTTKVGGGQNPAGGSFIFATWEHIENDSAGFTYANYYDPNRDPQPIKAVNPKTGNQYTEPNYIPDISQGLGYTVQRMYPILAGTQAVNAGVLGAIRASDPNSVWLNYRLIGVQFEGEDFKQGATNPNDPNNIGLPYYLSNLVIETNVGLQKFQGLPPQVTVTQWYKDKTGLVDNTLATFNRDAKNLSFNQQPLNMGGCMGCHGVAQISGYSFSFVLLGGQAGADPDSEKRFAIPITKNPATPQKP